MTSKPRVLILSSAEGVDTMALNDKLVQGLNERIGDEVSVEWHNYHDIEMEIAPGKLEVILHSSKTPLSEFDFVYIKSYFRYSELAGAIVSYLDSTNTKFVCTELRDHLPLTKLTQLVRMSLHNVPIAKTIFMLSREFSASYDDVVSRLGTPFIFKSIDGSTGEENFLIRSEDELKAALAEFPKLHFIAQAFIENDSDLRVLVVDKKIQLVIKRQRTDNSSHLNNTSQGAAASLVPLNELTPEHQAISLKAAEIMGRETAGVDLLFELGTGAPFILEVNASPQITSGAFEQEKLAIFSDYFKEVVKE